MKTQEVLDPQQWAERTFGSTRLKDLRRTRRAVSAAAQMARDASASLPHQMQSCKEVKALSRLLDEADVTFEALMQPHWQETQACLQGQARVLRVPDTTELDLSPRRTMAGLGPIGHAKGRGMRLANGPGSCAGKPNGLGMHGPKTLYPCSNSPQRATLSASPSRAQGNCCVDTDGRTGWSSCRSRLAGPRRGSSS